MQFEHIFPAPRPLWARIQDENREITGAMPVIALGEALHQGMRIVMPLVLKEGDKAPLAAMQLPGYAGLYFSEARALNRPEQYRSVTEIPPLSSGSPARTAAEVDAGVHA